MGKTMYKVYYRCIKKGELEQESEWIILDNLDNLTDLFDCMHRDGYEMNVYDIERFEDDR